MKSFFEIIALLTLPATAYASGNEALSLLWIILLVFIVVVASMFIIKVPLKQKAIIFVVYIIASITSYVATGNMPYIENMYLINSVNLSFPLLSWLVAYVYYYKQSKT